MFISIETIKNRSKLEPMYEDNTAEAEEQVEIILRKIAKKHSPARDIIYLNFIMGVKPAIIADRLELDPRNVRECLYRFRKEIS